MKICLVTTFPPSTGGLSEYGFHIAQELQRNSFLNLTVLADELPGQPKEPEGFHVERCWSFNDPRSVVRLLKAVNRLKPDVVWFNLLFSTFGHRPVAAFSGLTTPLLARLGGRYTHVTLHHLMDTVDLKDAGVKHEWLYRSAGAIATRMLLLSNSVSVLMPGYRKILNDKYGRDNVHLRSHGILARRPEFPDFSRRGNPPKILAFGKWGTYKRLELMIDAFQILNAKMPEAKLVIAGGDHPHAAGYTNSMKQRCAGNRQIEFRGYVPEDALEDLFQSSNVAVMPYSSSTGCSGVAHLACGFGVPIICADLPDFRQMAQGEELAIEFYPPGDPEGLAACLYDLLRSQEKQQAMAAQNFSAALRMTMPNVVQKYLRQFLLQQRTQVMKNVSRVRRLPDWVPTKSLLLRYMTRNSLSWARRSAIIHTPWNGHGELPSPYGHSNRRGKQGGTGSTAHNDGVNAGRLGTDGSAGSSAARRSRDGEKRQNEKTENVDRLARQLPDQQQAEASEGIDAGQKDGISPAGPIGRNGSGANGKNGSGGSAAGNDGRWSEGTSESAGQGAAGELDGGVEGAGVRRSGNLNRS